MPASLNAQLAEAFVEEDLQARRVEAQLRREVLALLALLQADLVAALKASDPTAYALLRRRKRAGKVFLDEDATPLITTRYAQIAGQLDTALPRLARHQADQAQTLVNAVTGTGTVTELPSARELRLRVTEGLFPSASTPTDASTTGAAWWTRQGEGLVTRLGDQVQVSVGLDESLTQLTQRVTGTAAQGGQDGLMTKAATDATRLLTTQTTNAVSEARVAVAEANQEQFILVHQSILDSRTCLGGHTLLRTPEGLREIRSLEVDEMVYGGSGQPRRILATHTQQVTQLARITFSDGTVVLCTPDHRFLTADSGWVSAENLSENVTLRTDYIV